MNLNKKRNRVGRVVFLTLSLVNFVCESTLAHNSPSSAVMLDFYHESVGAELTLPLAELELSFKQPLLADPAQSFAKYQLALKSYISSHVNPTADNGRAWSVTVDRIKLQTNQQPFDLIANLTLTPPTDASARKFLFNYSVINHEVMSHCVFVSVRNDWNTAVFSGNPKLLGQIHFNITSLEIDRSKGSFAQGFRSVFTLGLHHIAEGTDHLLFLLVLLLPAPLMAEKGRWGKFGGWMPSLSKLFKIVSAFTLGHSLTLLLAAAGWLRLPPQPIEILIAVSIFVSAIHAIRPWMAGKEVFIAAGFGLVHGLAFAESVSGFGFSPWYLACTVFGFNLGIETMQLIVVCATIPWLLLLARTRFYSPLRIIGAGFGGIAALGWIAERLFKWQTPTDLVVNRLASHPFWVVISLALVSLITSLHKILSEAPVIPHMELAFEPITHFNKKS